MKYFIDTEFHEYEIRDDLQNKRPTIDLISIGIVREDGEEFYRISDGFNINDAVGNEWLAENVLKPICLELNPEIQWESAKHRQTQTVYGLISQNSQKSELVKSRYNIIQDLIKFFGDDETPEFYAYFADYDWVVFCWLFGRMIDLPKGFPMYCRDLKQMMDERQLSKEWKRDMCPDPEGIHNALEDAKWNLRLYKAMNLSATIKVL